jgi:hypothetical protein
MAAYGLGGQLITDAGSKQGLLRHLDLIHITRLDLIHVLGQVSSTTPGLISSTHSDRSHPRTRLDLIHARG